VAVWVAVLAVGLSGCQSLPFAPRYTYLAGPGPTAEAGQSVVWSDARPSWQKRYWQGAETPRDHELAISVIPLERLSPQSNPEVTGLTEAEFKRQSHDSLAPAAWEARGVLATVLGDHPEIVPPTRFELTKFVVVVNKQVALQQQWEESADERREALSRWRQGPALRTSLGLGGGFGPGWGPTQMGAGLMVGTPTEIPLLPGERPVARVYGAVRGPPPELDAYGPDVTCDLAGRWEVTDRQGRTVLHDLRATTRSLPLEPPHLLPDQAVAAGVRQLMRVLERNARAALGESSEPASDPAGEK